MFKLRDYQNDFVGRVREAWQNVRGVLAVLPTGGGKTVCFASIIHDHVGGAIAVVHRREIVTQISLALAKEGVKHRVIAPDKTIKMIRRKHLKVVGVCFIDNGAQVAVASVQTLTAKSVAANPSIMRFIEQVTLAVFDEGHHYVDSGTWARAVDLVERAKMLFITATPERADGKGLGTVAAGYADVMVEGPPTSWLIEQGFLSKFKYFAPESDLDWEGVAVTASGDLNAQALRARVKDSHLVGDAVTHYQKLTPGTQAIVFAESIPTALELEDEFNARGISARELNGSTDEAVREKVVAQFEAGEVQVLINVDLFDEGFDVPAAETAILVRRTTSLAKYLQMCGRVLRVAEGKPFAYIIDPVKNWEVHAFPDTPRVWSLESRAKRESSSSVDDAIPSRACKGCTQPYRITLKACPYCGYVHEYADRSGPDKVEGDLHAIDVDALNAIFKRQQQVDATTEEFMQSAEYWSMPPIGRRAAVARHESAKYRRDVLRNLVGWWVGAQGGRDMSDVHIRFNHRFGVDIGNAFTLNTGDTDALINKITNLFAVDLD